MMKLHLFGGAHLETSEGEHVSAVLAQPKRLGLLTYLTLESRSRPMLRDGVLPVFWPEFDTHSARRALRKSLYFLRRHLGADVLVGHGDEQIGVA